MSEKLQEISTDQTPHVWFTQMPNIALKELNPNAYKLLAVYLDISATGTCYATNAEVTNRMGVKSANTMKAARADLEKKGYIHVIDGVKSTSETAKIQVQLKWMWQHNYDEFKRTVSKSDTPMSNIDMPPYQNMTTPMSKSDIKQEEDNNNNNKKNKSIASSDAVALPFAEGEGQARVFLNDEAGNTADVSETEEQDITPDVDTNKAARGLIAVYLKTTKSVEKSAYKFYMSEAQELTQQNITPAHIAEFIKEKSKDAFWQNQNVTWSHLVKNIIAWRDKHRDKKHIDELPIPEGAQGPNDPTAWMAKPVTTDNASANEAKRSA